MQKEGKESRARRDQLLSFQKAAQEFWNRENVFEVDALDTPDPDNKFFANFPYPYMNGLLHLGHAFSLSKAEFATAYKRLIGKRALFPFAFHCTGMPIKACADKLDREITTYGNPPAFKKEEDLPTAGDEANKANDTGPTDPTKFKTKKSKAAAKAGTAKHQWEIMQSLGIEDSDIARFRDPYYWLEYFPPLAKEDLKAFGLGVDWRRSFITTDMNPYYDAFIRWHLNTLYKKGKVVKDNRFAIFSPLDGQPCADHDRASGEGVQPQEYTLIKMEVVKPYPGKLAALEGKQVYLAAATLRPETMYGQTNAWVLPDGDYGAFEINEKEVFVVTARAALNLSYQNQSKVTGKPNCLLELKGQDLIGLPLKSPLAINPIIYALPMLTILTDKGTGVVTSVPSDAPDDYAALMDMKQKPALRSKYGVKDEWVLPFEVIPIINIPEFGDMSAVKVCTDLKIKSQNDKDKLAEAKHLTYLKGFVEGTMLVGEHKGAKVQDAKPIIKKQLVEAGQAVIYSEPEKKVISRSGDECVVALTDQWYITYGEAEWKAQAEQCLAKMEVFHDETRHGFEHTLGWLNQWACSRSFGLGTRLPWDPQYLIESLSDSTIYMAYYTVAHILQGGDLYGKASTGITPEQLTDEVFDYVFLGKDIPKTDIPTEVLQTMRKEFEFWYPFDLRVSGKDLIQNHLTFAIYNHTAIFPETHWPLAFRCNGHLMLNSDKMSKSTGNFLTLKEAIEKYSSDATRFALADAGDTMDDANFLEETADTAILRLTKELAWFEECVSGQSGLRSNGDLSFADKVFENEIRIAIAVTKDHYEHMMFREALQAGFYAFQNARDEYRVACGSAGMHKELVLRFIEAQTVLLTPICPHFCEHVWRHVLKKTKTVLTAGWPAASAPDYTLKRANTYLQTAISDFRKVIQKQSAAPKKAPKGAAAPQKPTIAYIFVAEKFGGWQEVVLRMLAEEFDAKDKKFPNDGELMAKLKASEIASRADFKSVMKQCMPFLKFKKEEALSVGPQALDSKLPFDELNTLRNNADYIKRSLALEELEIASVDDSAAVAKLGPDSAKVAGALPGSPVAIFSAVPLGSKAQLYVPEGSLGSRVLQHFVAQAKPNVELKPLTADAPPAVLSAAGSLEDPVLLDGVVAVSGVASVLRHLAELSCQGQLYPPPSAADARAKVDEVLDWCSVNLIAKSRDMEKSLSGLEKWLSAGHLKGECATIGSILLSVALVDLGSRGLRIEDYPAIASWLKVVQTS